MKRREQEREQDSEIETESMCMQESETDPKDLKNRERVCERESAHKGESGREQERNLWRFGSSFYIFSPPPGPVLCKSGQPGVLFVPPEVLTQVLGPSFVLFPRAFPFLVF